MSLELSDIQCEIVPSLCPVGYANVNSDGTIDSEFGGVVVSNPSAGQYTISPPNNAVTSVFTVLEPFGTRDDIQLSKVDFIGSAIHITEQDNGANPGTPRNKAFSVIYYGVVEKPVIICDEIDPLLCDEDLVSELIVIRPDDTPNNGWNNENLETGNQLSDDVEMCFTISASTGNTPQMIGLDSDDPNAAFNTLDYSFYVYTANSNNLLRIYENGANVANLTAWAVGDELCIRRNNGIVTYYVNGSLVHTSATTSTAPLQVGSSFYFANGFWSDGTISFSDIAFCQVAPSNEMRVANRLSQPDSIELAASDPQLLEVWNTLTLTVDHYPILQGYEVTEKDLIKYIKKNQ